MLLMMMLLMMTTMTMMTMVRLTAMTSPVKSHHVSPSSSSSSSSRLGEEGGITSRGIFGRALWSIIRRDAFPPCPHHVGAQALEVTWREVPYRVGVEVGVTCWNFSCCGKEGGRRGGSGDGNAMFVL